MCIDQRKYLSENTAKKIVQINESPYTSLICPVKEVETNFMAPSKENIAKNVGTNPKNPKNTNPYDR